MIVLAGLAAAWWIYRPFSAGPLSLGDATDTTFSIDVGGTATFGGAILKNLGSKTARIDRIELVSDGDVSSARIVDVRILDLRKARGSTVGVDDVFARPPDSVPPAGAQIAATRNPPDGYQILFGIQMIRTGAARYENVRVDYHIGLTRYHLVGRHSFKLCAPRRPLCEL